MSDGLRGRRGRQRINRPLEMRCDASLSEYFSFFWSLPTHRNPTTSWEELQCLDGGKTAFDNCEAEQDLGTEWDSNSAEKGMDDQAVVVDDDKSTSYTTVGTPFSGVGSENGSSKQVESICNRLFLETSPPSLSSGTLNVVQSSLNNFQNGKAMKMNSGVKQLCVICGGLANGYHFGALSCAACNAFFRRSVAESRKYFCRKSGHCVIDQAARCFCRACRLKKCLECGMDPNAVQPHRDMIGQKRKRSVSDHRADSVNSGISLETSSSSDLKTPEKELLKSSLNDVITNAISEDRVVSNNNGMITPNEQCKALALQQSFGPCTDDIAKRPKYNESATAHLLTSTNIIAESLIAFSRTPLIGPMYNDLSNGKTDVSSQGNSNKTKVTHAISTMKFSRATVANDPMKSVTQATFSPQLSQPVGASKTYSSDRFNPCITQQSASHFADPNNNILANEVPSGSSDWPQDADASTFLWNTAVPHSKTRSPSIPKSDYDPSKNTIEILVEAYRRLRERRRLLFCPPTLRDMLGGTEAPLRSMPLGSALQSLCRMDCGLLVEFFNLVHPFAKLRLDDRIMLVKNAGVPYTMMEKFYVTMRGGGFQANRVINNDNSYHDLAFSDNEDEGHDKEDLPYVETEKGEESMVKTDYRTVKRLLLPEIRDSMRDIAGAMYHSGMTDVEFVALAVIILLDHTAPNLSDVARRLVKEARDHLYLDWFAYYEAHNMSDGPQRVGNALLLLPAIYVTSKKQAENYYLVRFFNLFELTSLIDDVMK